MRSVYVTPGCSSGHVLVTQLTSARPVCVGSYATVCASASMVTDWPALRLAPLLNANVMTGTDGGVSVIDGAAAGPHSVNTGRTGRSPAERMLPVRAGELPTGYVRGNVSG